MHKNVCASNIPQNRHNLTSIKTIINLELYKTQVNVVIIIACSTVHCMRPEGYSVDVYSCLTSLQRPGDSDSQSLTIPQGFQTKSG